jgi:hypothetical protein
MKTVSIHSFKNTFSFKMNQIRFKPGSFEVSLTSDKKQDGDLKSGGHDGRVLLLMPHRRFGTSILRHHATGRALAAIQLELNPSGVQYTPSSGSGGSDASVVNKLDQVEFVTAYGYQEPSGAKRSVLRFISSLPEARMAFHLHNLCHEGAKRRLEIHQSGECDFSSPFDHCSIV